MKTGLDDKTRDRVARTDIRSPVDGIVNTLELNTLGAFVQPGATRIDSPNFVTYGTDSSNIETVSSGLDDVAFLNPDGSKVLIAYNNSSAPIPFDVQTDGRYFTYTIPAQAMTTFVWT